MIRTYRLECEMTVARSLSEVFAVFEDPRNLSGITPPWLRFRVVGGADLTMRRGLKIDYLLRWLIVPLRWRTRITEYDPPHSFTDEAIRSPFVLWRHRHTFERTQTGTLVRDAVDYRLPFGWLGNLAHAAIVKRQLIAIFTYRQRTLSRQWGGETSIRWPTVREL